MLCIQLEAPKHAYLNPVIFDRILRPAANLRHGLGCFRKKLGGVNGGFLGPQMNGESGKSHDERHL
jgi:hypothetical protein